MLQQPWMVEAWREFGQRETPGRVDNPRILAMLADAGHPGQPDETPWCAAFIGACLVRAGIPGTGSLAARSYLDWGVGADGPALGAVAVLTRSADPALGHVGFVVGTTEAHLFLLGGNQSNAVTVEAFTRSRVLAYRLPSRSARSSNPTAAAPLFEQALAHVLRMEGGWSDDPYDPGGPTNKGITLATFARVKGRPLTPSSTAALTVDLRAISDDLVRSIYEGQYWLPARCAALPPPLALMHFDASVNHGVGAAARLLQEALDVEIDGDIGPLTLAAARAARGATAIKLYAAARERRYRNLPHFWRFGRGWLKRVDSTLAAARGLLDASPRPPDPKRLPQPEKETKIMSDETPSPAPKSELGPDVKWWGHSMTIWGTLITALTTVLPVVGKLFGFGITPDLVERLGQELLVLFQAAGGLLGTIMAIVGRSRASTQIQRRPVRLSL